MTEILKHVALAILYCIVGVLSMFSIAYMLSSYLVNFGG